jgi:hypothetical protein
MGAGGVHSPNSGECTGNVYISNGANFLGFCAPQDNPQPPPDSLDAAWVVSGDVNVGWVQGPMSGGTETFTGGPFVVTITPVTVDYNVTANPTTLNYNDTATVTATVSPSQVNAVNVPWAIDSISWAPAFGTQANPCAWNNWVTVNAGTRTCRRPFTRSGTLTVFATVQGVQTQNAFSIVVTPPTLKVTVSPATIQGPQSVTFTAAVTPSAISWNLSGWAWTPDHGTGGVYNGYCSWTEKTCTRIITRSGWMKATATIGEYTLADSGHVDVTRPQFKVTASPASIPGPQSVTFTATVTPTPGVPWNLSSWTWTPDSGTGGINNYCSWNENPCTRTISKSGTMTVVTTIGEYTLTASVHVSVLPCLTGDSSLDDSRIRRMLKMTLDSSSPNAPAASRLERLGTRLLRPDGSLLDTLQAIDGSTPCSVFPHTSLGNVGSVLIIWHSHPFNPLDTADALPFDPNTTPHSPCPQVDTLTVPPGGKVVSAPGPSFPGDYSSGYLNYVVEKTGDVWRANLDSTSTPFLKSQCDPLSHY